MARLMIFVQRPRHISSAEAKTWLEDQLVAFAADGVQTVQLKPLLTSSPRFGDSWAWLIELRCDDAESACEAIQHGAGMMFIADLRMLGMRPSLALVEGD